MYIKYGIINFENHCYARIILEKILMSGLPRPSIIIQERSSTAVKRCRWYSTILQKANITPPTIAELLEKYKNQDDYKKTKILYVDNMNGQDVVAAVKAENLDILLLGGASIMKEEIFSEPKHGTLNVHPGYLPYVRGSLPVAWSLVKGEIVGCTCHKVTNVLDGGDWIFRDSIDVKRGMSFDEIVHKTCLLAGDQMTRALFELIKNDTLVSTPFLSGDMGPNFKWSSTITDRARETLRKEEYPLLIDD